MLKGLFGKKDKDPIPTWSHPVLGQANWDPNSNQWVGLIHGVPYFLAYDSSGQPNKKLVGYAESIIGNQQLFINLFAEARGEGTRRFSEFLKDEIDALQPATIQFFIEHKEMHMHISMLGGPAERPWMIKYKELESWGLNFQ